MDARMTAIRTSRWRASMASRLLAHLEKLDKQGVREQETALGEPRPAAGDRQQASFLPGIEPCRERGVERRALGQPRGGYAVEGAEAEDQPFARFLAVAQHLVPGDGEQFALEEVAVAVRRSRVAVAYPAQKAAGAGSEPEILAALPVDLIVAGAAAPERVVGDHVMLVAGRGGAPGKRPALLEQPVLRGKTRLARPAPHAAPSARP